MSTRFITVCDRCKRETNDAALETGWMVVTWIGIGNVDRTPKAQDLCPRCAEDFKKTITSKP